MQHIDTDLKIIHNNEGAIHSDFIENIVMAENKIKYETQGGGTDGQVRIV